MDGVLAVIGMPRAVLNAHLGVEPHAFPGVGRRWGFLDSQARRKPAYKMTDHSIHRSSDVRHAGAFVLAVLCASEIAGWLLHSTAMVEVLPNADPMPFCEHPGRKSDKGRLAVRCWTRPLRFAGSGWRRAGTSRARRGGGPGSIGAGRACPG